MKNTVRHYLKVYQGYILTCLSQATSFRFHFVLLILVDLFFYFSSLVSVDFIYDHVETIGPWSRDQLMFFLSVMLAIDQIHMTFISESFWILSYLIRSGNLDFILLKPIGSLFQVFFRNIRPASMINFFVTTAMVIFFGVKVDLGPADFLLLPFLILLGFFLLIQMEFLMSCSMFWMLEGTGINFLRMEMQRLSRWPDFIYGRWARRVFLFVFPVLLIGNAPVRFLFDRSDYGPLIFLLGGNLVLAMILKFVWRKALMAYESASS